MESTLWFHNYSSDSLKSSMIGGKRAMLHKISEEYWNDKTTDTSKLNIPLRDSFGSLESIERIEIFKKMLQISQPRVQEKSPTRKRLGKFKILGTMMRSGDQGLVKQLILSCRNLKMPFKVSERSMAINTKQGIYNILCHHISQKLVPWH